MFCACFHKIFPMVSRVVLYAVFILSFMGNTASRQTPPASPARLLPPHLSTGFPQSLHTPVSTALRLTQTIRSHYKSTLSYATATQHSPPFCTIHHICLHTFPTRFPHITHARPHPLRQRKTPALPIGKAGEFSWECDQEAGWPVFRTINQTQPSGPMITDPACPPHQPTTPGT